MISVIIAFLHGVANWVWSTTRNFVMAPFEDRDYRGLLEQYVKHAQRVASQAQDSQREALDREREWITKYNELRENCDEWIEIARSQGGTLKEQGELFTSMAVEELDHYREIKELQLKLIAVLEDRNALREQLAQRKNTAS